MRLLALIIEAPWCHTIPPAARALPLPQRCARQLPHDNLQTRKKERERERVGVCGCVGVCEGGRKECVRACRSEQVRRPLEGGATKGPFDPCTPRDVSSLPFSFPSPSLSLSPATRVPSTAIAHCGKDTPPAPTVPPHPISISVSVSIRYSNHHYRRKKSTHTHTHEHTTHTHTHALL